MMKKVATIAALAMLAQNANGACADNWVKTSISVTGEGDTANNNDPLTGDNTYNTCASIKTPGPTCCTSTEVNTFQAKATTLVETLKTAVSTRDQYILDRRGDVLDVRDSLNSIQESMSTLSTDSTAAAIAALLTTFTSSYTTIIESFTEDFAALKTGFVTLQQNRVDCFNALVKAQVSIWCAACAETPTGFTEATTTTGTVAFGSVFSTYLAEECNAYIASAAQQSGILSLYAVADSFALLASALNKVVDGDITGATTEITEFMTDFGTVVAPTNDLQKVGYAPATCSATSCDWASSLLSTGSLDTNLATVGGSLIAARRLQEVPAGRMLQLDSDPDAEAAGITVAFPENPGNVDNDQNSAVRNGAIACAITALAALL